MISKIKMYEYIINLIEQRDELTKKELMYLEYLEWKLDKLKKKKEKFVVKVEHDVDLGDLNY
jgi:hypothetical protein